MTVIDLLMSLEPKDRGLLMLIGMVVGALLIGHIVSSVCHIFYKPESLEESDK